MTTAATDYPDDWQFLTEEAGYTVETRELAHGLTALLLCDTHHQPVRHQPPPQPKPTRKRKARR